MLNKELLCTALSSTGYRKIIAGRYGISRGWSSSMGSISDPMVDGHQMSSVVSYDYGDTEISFSYQKILMNTVYLQVEGRDLLALHWYGTGQDAVYDNAGAECFTVKDVGRTLNVYIGTTPP